MVDITQKYYWADIFNSMYIEKQQIKTLLEVEISKYIKSHSKKENKTYYDLSKSVKGLNINSNIMKKLAKSLNVIILDKWSDN